MSDSKIPGFLIAQPRWLLWREIRHGERLTKEPMDYRTGQPMAVTRPEGWADHATIEAALRRQPGRWNGAGIVLGDTYDGYILAGLDLDASLDAEQSVAIWARQYIAILNTYGEVSPSGTGLKLFFRVKADDLGTFRHALGLADQEHGRKRTYGLKPTDGGHAPGAEIYLALRYFTVTGNHWFDCAEDVAIVSAGQLAALAELFGPRAKSSNAPPVDHTAPDEAALRDKLSALLGRLPRLRARWLGDHAGLADTTRSGFAMSLGAMLKAAGFSYSEMRASLIANPFSGAGEHADDDRYFERIWSRTVVEEPEPAPPPPPEREAEPDAAAAAADERDDDEIRHALWNRLHYDHWKSRVIPAAEQLLGDFIFRGSRTFLVGRTGLGKTLLAYALAFGMATGRGFLHWRAARPSNVLVIDGEMPPRLVQRRLVDECERTAAPLSGGLLCYSRSDSETLAADFPMLGPMPALNTEPGINWMLSLLISLGDSIDVVIFDNVMSLLIGDQKDELAWSAVVPLVDAISRRGIAQVWLDHTGHAGDRQYGSATKAWRFDTVGVMTPLEDGVLQPGETGLKLSFDYPGKARQREPDNEQDYAPTAIRLSGGQWTGEPADQVFPRVMREKVKPASVKYFEALVDALSLDLMGDRRSTTMSLWRSECVRRGLIEPAEIGQGMRESSNARFRNAKHNLIHAGWIGISGETVSDVRNRK